MDSTQRTRPRTGGSPVGLVVFIILTVVFAVLAYWSFAKFQTADQDKASLQTKLSAAETNLNTVNGVNAKFQKVSGVSTPEQLTDAIKKTIEVTKAEGIGDNLENPTASQVLSQVVPDTITALKGIQATLQSDLDTANAQVKGLAEQKKQSDGTYEADIAAKIAEIQGLQKKLKDETDRLNARIAEEVAARESLRDQLYTERDTWKQDQTKMVLHIEDLKEKLRRISGEGAIVEKADATITAIDFDNKLVTINIGEDGGVKPPMHFIVFSRDAKKQPVTKGVIEIVKVLPKVAVGRVISQEPDMAIGKGDSVYNLAGPQKKLFVFAGTPKLYTLQQWTNTIRANGGDVVSDVQKGDQVADYLILGEFDQQDPTATKEIFDARDFGVKILKESDLKAYMGMK
jgi:hypothetical protein